jgi:Raf kinase inhibitor-like YbhB/YbcL family protein
MQLTSFAFQHDSEIPAKHTCKGANVSPSLEWSGAPAAAKTLALIMHDPDAPSGDFTHWVLFNLPATEKSLAENVPQQPQLPSGAAQGMNDFGKVGYGGPCPPPGPKHRYEFTLYALDGKLDMKPSAPRAAVESAMRGHILAQAELEGTFAR